jgi:PKHD-type hydroxylase
MFRTYQLVPQSDALEILGRIRDLEWKQGKARTEKATGTIKRNLELKANDDSLAKDFLTRLQHKIATHPQIARDTLLRRTMCPKFNRYTPESPEYRRHGDAASMGGTVRTDMSCTVFLTPPDDYEGGVLCVEDTFGGYVEVKGDPGMCVIYTGGCPHWVTPVTKGERISAVTWIQSHVQDDHQRNLLSSFGNCLTEIEETREEWPEVYTTLGIINGNLLRMWMDP